MRVKLHLPDRRENFLCEYQIGVSDLNYGNHMGNDRFLTLAHEARLQFFDQLGMDELSFFGEALIMSDSMVQYKAQGFRGERLQVKVWVDKIAERSFDLLYSVTKRSEEKPIEMARIKTGMVFYNYESQKIVKTPADFYQRFQMSPS